MSEQYIFRSMPKDDFTIINNDVFKAGLSLTAIGLCCLLVSKPEDWTVKVEWLAREFKTSEGAVKRAMKELAELGFLIRRREHAADGTVTTVTLVADCARWVDVGTGEQRLAGYGYEITDPPKNRPSVKPTLGKTDPRLNRPSVNEGVIQRNEIPLSTEQLLSTDSSVADAPAHRKPAASSKKKAEEPHPDTKAITDAYAEVCSSITNWGKEGAAAKAIAKSGFTPEDVVVMYDILKAEPYWQRKHLGLATIHGDLLARREAVRKGLSPVTPSSNGNGRMSNVERGEAAANELRAMLIAQGKESILHG